MSLEYFLAFNLALLVAMASPGPAFLLAVRTALVGGRAAGVAVGGGLAIMAAGWTLLALLGLDSIFRLFPWVYVVAKFLGATYLIYVAYKTWVGAKSQISQAAIPRGNAFRAGILINLSNPKSVLFAAAVLLVIFPPDITPLAKALIIVNHLVVEIMFYSLLTFVMGGSVARRRYFSAKVWIDRTAAAVLGALGLRILLMR